jgi:hypothetical protein
MKKIIVVLLVISSLGFIVETPEMRRERERSDRAWQKAVAKSVDLPALRLFLIDHVSKNPVCDGVELNRALITKRWKPEGMALSCGDWYLVLDGPDDKDIELLWTYEEFRRPDRTLIHRVVEISVHREGRSSFVGLSTERRDDEMVELMP